MPVKVTLKVNLSQGLRQAAQRAPQVVTGFLSRAMQAAVLVTETKIKEFMTEIGLVDTGLMRSRVHGRVVSVNIHKVVGEAAIINDKRARIHEYGGVIKPVHAQSLAIPWNKESDRISAQGSLRNVEGLFVVKTGSGAVLRSRDNATIGWTLVKSVTIKEKRFMRTGLDRATPTIRDLFAKAAQGAMKAVFGRGGD